MFRTRGAGTARDVRVPATLALAAVALGAGCDVRVPERGAEPDGAREEAVAGTVTPARYLNAYLFVAGEADGERLYLRFLNRAWDGGLARDYRAWRAGPEGWRGLLAFRDTLPVPRAAWRVLPGPGLRVLVADGGEVGQLELGAGADTLRLALGAPLAEWTGVTGQREFLARADLRLGPRRSSGLVYFRRAARTEGPESARDADRVLLLADTLGNGLLVTSNTLHGSSSAWTSIDGQQGSWMNVGLTPREEASEGGRAAGSAVMEWTLDIPEAGIRGPIRVVREVAVEPPEATPGGEAGEPPPGAPVGERAVLLGALLRIGEETVNLRGLGLEAPLP